MKSVVDTCSEILLCRFTRYGCRWLVQFTGTNRHWTAAHVRDEHEQSCPFRRHAA